MAGVLKVWNTALGAYEPVMSASPVFDAQSGVRVRRTTTQSIDNTFDAISWSVEDYDTDSYWAIGDPTEIVAPYTGIYNINFYSYVPGTPSRAFATFQLNGSDVAGVQFECGNGNVETSIEGGTDLWMEAGDILTVHGYSSPTKNWGYTSTTVPNLRLTVSYSGGVAGVDGATGATGAAGADGTGVAYPVGALFTTTAVYADSAAVATALGYGTWTAFGAGRVLMGEDGGTYTPSEDTGGAETQATHTHTGPSHTHTEDYLPSHIHTDGNHTHGERVRAAVGGSSMNVQRTNSYSTGSLASVQNTDGTNLSSDATSAGGSQTGASGTAATGAGGGESIVQPYIVVYFWKRTV